MKRTAHDNAREFGRINQQGFGVHLALLAACSIDDTGTGGRPVAGNRAPARSSKMSVRAFATEAGVAESAIREHLKKWDKMVAAGWANMNRTKLVPDDVDVIDMTAKFIKEFDALTEERPSTRHLSLSKMAEAIKEDPKVAQAAYKAVVESEHRDAGHVSRVNKPPTTKEGREMVAELQAANTAGNTIAGPIYEAADLLQQAQQAWSEHEGGLDRGERRRVKQTLTDILVMVEALRMEFGFADATR